MLMAEVLAAPFSQAAASFWQQQKLTNATRTKRPKNKDRPASWSMLSNCSAHWVSLSQWKSYRWLQNSTTSAHLKKKAPLFFSCFHMFESGRSWLNTHLVKTLFGQCAMFRCVIPLGVEQQLDNTKAKKENRTKTSFNIAGTSRAGQRCSTRSYFPPWPNKVSPSFPSPQQGPKTGR